MVTISRTYHIPGGNGMPSIVVTGLAVEQESRVTKDLETSKGVCGFPKTSPGFAFGTMNAFFE